MCPDCPRHSSIGVPCKMCGNYFFGKLRVRRPPPSHTPAVKRDENVIATEMSGLRSHYLAEILQPDPEEPTNERDRNPGSP